MEALCTDIRALLLPDLGAEFLSPLQGFRLRRDPNSFSERLGGKLGVRNGIRTRPSAGHHGTPEQLVAEERYDDRRLPGVDTGGRGPGAAVVAYCGNVFEEPVVRHVTQHEDAVRDAYVVGPQTTPAFGYESADPSFRHRVEYHTCELIRVIHDDRSEANVNGRRSCLEECRQFGFGREGGRQVEEIEPRNINVVSPILRLRYECRGPIESDENLSNHSADEDCFNLPAVRVGNAKAGDDGRRPQ